ncbi:hypothetical protein ABEW68_32940 [Paenibacillus lautus]|uniref:hypothetical protein n=1 Tax=Paenibacillus lautus TaxID=1401 RepID=UPI003D2E2729
MGVYVICQQDSSVVRAVFKNVQPDQIEPGTIHTNEEVVPKPEGILGLTPVLMLDKETNTFYYDYYAQDFLLMRLHSVNDELNTTIGTLLMENANDKATISSLEETVGTLLMEVATLKGGAE